MFCSLRLSAMSRTIALLALSLFSSLWEEIGQISLSHLSCGAWNISRSIYNPLRSRPLFARYRTKISAALCNSASCMKNRLPGAFPLETDIGRVSSFHAKLTRSRAARKCKLADPAAIRSALLPNYAVGDFRSTNIS